MCVCVSINLKYGGVCKYILYNLTSVIRSLLAQSTGTVKYTGCISAEG